MYRFISLQDVDRYLMEFTMDSYHGTNPGNTVTDANGVALACVMDEANREFHADVWIVTDGISVGIFRSREEALLGRDTSRGYDLEDKLVILPLKMLHIDVHLGKYDGDKFIEAEEGVPIGYFKAIDILEKSDDPELSLAFDFLAPRVFITDDFDIFNISFRNVGEVSYDLVDASNVMLLGDNAELHLQNEANMKPIVESLRPFNPNIQEYQFIGGSFGMMPGDIVYLAKVIDGKDVEWIEIYID